MPQFPQDLLDVVNSNPPAQTVGSAIHTFRMSRSASPDMVAQSFEEHQSYLDSLNQSTLGLINYLYSASLVVPTQHLVQRVNLVSGQTITVTAVAPVSEGDSLTVFVKSDGPTGVLAWNPAQFRFASTEFDSTANLYTIFSFLAAQDPANSNQLRWFQTTLQLTGQS